MKIKLSSLLLAAILLLALVVRLYHLGSLPKGTHVDEASWAYNAYSVLETGRDEHGVWLPMIFRASGDQKLPLFTYLVVPFVKVFGVNNLAVRLPATLITVLIVYVLYRLLKEFKLSEPASLLGALIAATAPWTLIMNRVFGYDSLTGLLCYTTGLWWFLAGIRQKKLSLFILSAIVFGLSWYSYIAYRVATPLTLIILVLIFLRSRLMPKKEAWIMFFTFALTVLPLLLVTIKGQGSNRFGQVMDVSFKGMVMTIDENRYYCTNHLPRIICNLLYNKGNFFVRELIFRYLETYSPGYLFIHGEDLDYLKVDNYGLLYLTVFPFYIIGLVTICQQIIHRKNIKVNWLIILSLLITPLAALIVSGPQKVRLTPILPFIIAIIALGIQISIDHLSNKRLQKIFLEIISGVLLVNTSVFLFDFLYVYIPKNEFHFQDYAPLIKYIKQFPKEEIYVKSVGEPIVYYAFVNQIDPSSYQKEVKREPVNELGFSYATDYRNIHRTSLSPAEIACLLRKENKPGLLVTNEDLVGQKLFKKDRYLIHSANKVFVFQYVYSFRDFIWDNVDCP